MKEWTHHHFSHYDIYMCDCDKPCGEQEESCVFNQKTCHAQKHHFSKTHFYPHFLPDLYVVTDEAILLFEVEDYSPMTKEKMCRINKWFLECDMEFEPEIIIYGFDRFANLQRIIYNPITSKENAIEWLLDLESTSDYNTKNLTKFKLREDREESFRSLYPDDSIGLCKAYKEKEHEFKHYYSYYDLRKETKDYKTQY